MQGWLPRDIWSDARHYQIAALSTLVIFNFGWLDFGARPLNSALALTSTILTQILCSRLYGLPSIDLRSPLITGLSLSLLLRADEPWLHAVAGGRLVSPASSNLPPAGRVVSRRSGRVGCCPGAGPTRL